MLRTLTPEAREVVVIDRLCEWRPPFSPAEVVREASAILASYGVFEVVGDRYAGDWPTERFAECGVSYVHAPEPKSGLYLAALPSFTAREVELIDHPRLARQLIALERRTSRAGRDTIDHPPRGHDDCANAVCGVIAVACAARSGWFDEEEAYGV